MIGTPRLVYTKALETAVIPMVVPRGEIMQAFGPAIDELLEVLKRQGVSATGPCFARYFSITETTFDFEVGYAVAEPVTPEGRVRGSVWPATKLLRAMYQGPYGGLHEAWVEFGTWIKASSYTRGPGISECYLRGPESTDDAQAYVTELGQPVE